jgi:hypothetical protein
MSAAAGTHASPASAAGSASLSAGAGGANVPGSAGSSGVAGTAGSATSSGAGSTAAPAPANATCDRACLTAFNDSYLQALVARDASMLATAANIRFTENGAELQLTQGLWTAARSLGSYRQDFAEVPAGQTAGFVLLNDDRGDVLLAFRMKVVEHKVTELETTVCRSGEATFFSPSSLRHNDLYDQDIDAARRMSRDQLAATVDLYFKGLESGDGSTIPFDSGARRNENGTTTAMGSGLQNVAMFSYIEQIDRRYALVDTERGNVLPWVLFQIPMGLGGSRTLHLAELFKVDSAKIMDIQAIMVNQPLGTPGGWE